MIINAENLAALGQGLNQNFREGLNAPVPMDETRIATVVSSSTDIENYPMTAFADTISKWVGPRKIGTLIAKNLQVANDDYEATVAVPANAIKDDKIALYSQVAAGKGRQCRALWPKLAILALCTNGKWLDNAAFFGTTRKYGKATISNLVGAALSEATFNAGILAMQSYMSYTGEPLEITPDLLLVGPKLRTTAFDLVKAQNKISIAGTNTAAAAVPNANAGLLDYLVHPQLVGDYDDYWFLLCTTGVVKPVLVQKRDEGPLVGLDRPTDANVFFGMTPGSDQVIPGGVYVYGSHYRGAAALTIPHLAYAGIL